MLINTISSGNIPDMYLKYLKKIQKYREEMIQDLKPEKEAGLLFIWNGKKRDQTMMIKTRITGQTSYFSQDL